MKAFESRLARNEVMQPMIDDGTFTEILTLALDDVRSGQVTPEFRTQLERDFANIVTRTRPWIIGEKNRRQVYENVIEVLSGEVLGEVLPKWTSDIGFHERLLADAGAQRLRAIHGKVSDDSIFKTLMGRAYGLPKWSDSATPGDDLASLLLSSDRESQRWYTVGALETWGGIANQRTAEIDKRQVDAVWDSVQSGDEPWMLHPLSLCVSTKLSSFFRDRVKVISAAKMFELAKRADPEAASAWVQACGQSSSHAAALANEHLTIALMNWLRNEQPELWTKHSSSLLRQKTLFGGMEIKDADSILSWFTSKDATQSSSAYQLVANKDLLEILLNANRYEQVESLVPETNESKDWSRYRAQLMLQSTVIEYFKRNSQLDKLLFFNDERLDEPSRRNVMATLVRSDAYIDALIEMDKLMVLTASIDLLDPRYQTSIRNELSRRKSYMSYLAETQGLRQSLENAETPTMRAALAKALLAKPAGGNQKPLELPDDPELFLLLFDTVVEARSWETRNLAASLLEREWFIQQFLRLHEAKDQRLLERFKSPLKSNWTSPLSAALRKDLILRLIESDQLAFLEPFLDAANERDRVSMAQAATWSSTLQRKFSEKGFTAQLIGRLEERRVDILSTELMVRIWSLSGDEAKSWRPRLESLAMKGSPTMISRFAIGLMNYQSGTDSPQTREFRSSEVYQSLCHTLRESNDPATGQLAKLLVDRSNSIKHLINAGMGNVAFDFVLRARKHLSDEKQVVWKLLVGPLREVPSDTRYRDELSLLCDETMTAFQSGTLREYIIIQSSISNGRLDRLIKAGYFEAVRDFSEQVKARLPTTLCMLYCNPDVVDYLRGQDPTSDLLVAELKGLDPRHLSHALNTALTRPESLAWVLDNHSMKFVTEQLERLKQANQDGWIRSNLANNRELLAYHLKNGDLEPLLNSGLLESSRSSQRSPFDQIVRYSSTRELVKSVRVKRQVVAMIQREPDAAKRTGMLQTMVQQPDVIDWVWQAGRQSILLDEIDRPSVTNQERVQYFGSYFKALRRCVSAWVSSVEKADAEDTGNPTLQDAISLSRELTLRGQASREHVYLVLASDAVKEEIKTLRKLVAMEPVEGSAEIRNQAVANDLLGQLLRTEGDIEGVSAIDASPRSFPWFMAIESNDWQTAATLIQSKQSPVAEVESTDDPFEIKPVEATKPNRVDELERLLMTMALANYQQDHEATGKEAAKVMEMIQDNDSDYLRLRDATSALLVAGEVADAIQIVASKTPKRDFYWKWARRFYDPALRTIGFRADQCDQCMDRLAGPEQRNTTDAVSYMLQVRRLLVEIGRSDAVNELDRTLLSYPKRNSHSKARRSAYFRHLISQSAQMPSAKDLAMKCMAAIAESEPTLLTLGFGFVYEDAWGNQLAEEAWLWWAISDKVLTEATASQRLEWVDQIVGREMESKQIVQWAEQFAASQNLHSSPVSPNGATSPFAQAGVRKSFRVPITFWRYGMHDRAGESILSRTTLFAEDHELLGRIAMDAGKNEQAADHFRDAWERDNRARYLAQVGLAVRENDPKLAAATFDAARRSVSSSNEAFRLANFLMRLEAPQIAARVFRDVRWFVEPGSTPYLASLIREAELSIKTPSVAANLYRQFALLHLRRSTPFDRAAGPIWIAARIHLMDALAAIDEADSDALHASWHRIRQVNLADTEVMITLLKRLREQDQAELADEVFQAHQQYLSSRIKKFSDSVSIADAMKRLTAANQPPAEQVQ